MGRRVSEYLVDLISKQVGDKGIVVWYDPEGVYTGSIGKLTIPNTSVLRYEDGFFALRAEIVVMQVEDQISFLGF